MTFYVAISLTLQIVIALLLLPSIEKHTGRDRKGKKRYRRWRSIDLLLCLSIIVTCLALFASISMGYFR